MEQIKVFIIAVTTFFGLQTPIISDHISVTVNLKEKAVLVEYENLVTSPEMLPAVEKDLKTLDTISTPDPDIKGWKLLSKTFTVKDSTLSVALVFSYEKKEQLKQLLLIQDSKNEEDSLYAMQIVPMFKNIVSNADSIVNDVIVWKYKKDSLNFSFDVVIDKFKPVSILPAWKALKNKK
jgi:hypothetical protein